MNNRKISAVIGAVFLASSVSATAAEGIYLGASLTGYYLDSERVISGHDDAGVIGVNLGYRFFNDWALEAGYGQSILEDELDVTRLNFLYYFGGEQQRVWRPYALLGVSYYERDDGDINLQPEQEYTHQASAGAGLSNMLSDHLELRADLRLLHKVREGQDGTNDGALNLQVNYYFSGATPAPVAEAPPPRPVPVAETEEAPAVRTITVRINVEFEFNKAVVRAIYGEELGAIANAMRVHDDIELVLEGHSDSTGPDNYNQSLSERRAAAVKARLVSEYGIDPGRISTVGYGESRPIADNSTEEGRARNRRVIGEMSYSEVEMD